MGLSAERVLFDKLGVAGVRAGKKLTEQRVLALTLMHYEKTASRLANPLALSLVSMIDTTTRAYGCAHNLNRPLRIYWLFCLRLGLLYFSVGKRFGCVCDCNTPNVTIELMLQSVSN